MKIKKSVLLEALKVLGKVVAQTSPVEVVRSVRFVGDGGRLRLLLMVKDFTVLSTAEPEQECHVMIPKVRTMIAARMSLNLRDLTSTLTGNFSSLLISLSLEIELDSFDFIGRCTRCSDERIKILQKE